MISYLKSVRDALPEDARADLDLAFAGDALAARRLMMRAPKRLRGHIAFLAYQAKVGNPAYREIMKAVWASETRYLLTGFWRQPVVRRMLARADFPVPELKHPVTIYRPLGVTRSKSGTVDLCWSLSRERAASEARRARAGERKILQATVDPSEIIYCGRGRGEQEVVTRHPVAGAVVVEPFAAGRGAAAEYPAALHHL